MPELGRFRAVLGTLGPMYRERALTFVTYAPSCIVELMISAARHANAMVGPLVLPEGKVGMIDASTILRPPTPRTRICASTTDLSSPPMRHVPAT